MQKQTLYKRYRNTVLQKIHKSLVKTNEKFTHKTKAKSKLKMNRLNTLRMKFKNLRGVHGSHINQGRRSRFAARVLLRADIHDQISSL